MKLLEQRSFLVTRSAASKGAFDLVAVRKDKILFVQVKRTKNRARRMHPKEVRILRTVEVPPNAIRLLCTKVDYDRWYVYEVQAVELIEISFESL
jgi:Holliday junction resolvase